MSDILKDGLPLGLRIYDTLIKQKRFIYNCRKGVKHYEYQYTDNCTFPPFQIVRASSPQDTFTVTLVCVDTGEEYNINTLCPDMVANISIETIGDYDYIIYPATHDCCDLAVTKGLFYLKVDDTENDWFSELFWIDADAEDLETFYRLWADGHIRSSEDMDLRIWD